MAHRFVDAYLPRPIVGYPAEVTPMFSTQITAVDSGAEGALRRWLDPLRSVSLPAGVRDNATFQAAYNHWLVMGGPAHTWPFRDPTDFASVQLQRINEPPTVSGMDQVLGVGDGVRTEFQLVKRYTVGAKNYDRSIHFPVVSTVVVTVDGVDPGALSPPLTWTVTREGGIVSFSNPVPNGLTVRAGFLFDLQVRFESDDTWRGIMRTWGVNGFADIPIQEVRYCED